MINIIEFWVRPTHGYKRYGNVVLRVHLNDSVNAPRAQSHLKMECPGVTLVAYNPLRLQFDAMRIISHLQTVYGRATSVTTHDANGDKTWSMYDDN